jgi:hypothetical protein
LYLCSKILDVHKHVLGCWGLRIEQHFHSGALLDDSQRMIELGKRQTV